MPQHKSTVLTSESLVEAVDPGGSGGVDGLVTEVDEETALDRGVDAVDKLEGLVLADLRALEGLLEAGHRLVVEGLGRGDGDKKLSTVGGHELLKVLEDLGGGAETAVLGEDVEEVEEDGGGALGDDLLEDLGTLTGGEGGVVCWRLHPNNDDENKTRNESMSVVVDQQQEKSASATGSNRRCASSRKLAQITYRSWTSARRSPGGTWRTR